MYANVKRAFLLLTVGILAIVTAVLVKIFQPYDLIFKWKLVMEEGGEIFNLWEKPPVDLYLKVYLFNITNAEAFLAGREKMNVEQVGPYVYKELMTHDNVSFNENNTMSTIPRHPLVWQEHMSEGHKEDDQVVMLNIAMLAISHLMVNKPYFFRLGLNTLFATSKAEPIVRMTAKEFMFGYETSLTTLGNTFLPNWISFEKVGLIDRMYDFSTDYETFYTGVSNPGISGLYATYRGDVNLPHWDGEHCSNIELASDGTKFKSFITPNESVKFFRKSMCRPINLYRTGEPEAHGSLSGYKYVFEENALDNGEFNEKNKCYCRKGYCQPRGLIDVTDCYYGFPISLSHPHFMNGDPGLQNNLTGLEPNEEKHSSAFVIQPESGLPLSISVKVQINMHFKDLSPFRKVSAFSHQTAPMLWFEIMMPKLPQSLESRFNFYLNYLPYIDILGFWGALVLGVVLVIYAVTRATLRMSQLKQNNIISDGKYSKANLLRGAASNIVNVGNKVYNPCEMKLLKVHEKSTKQHLITGNDDTFSENETDSSALANDNDYPNGKETAYHQQRDSRRHSSFALELEPAISDTDSTDDGQESDNMTRSRKSSSCSLTIDSQHNKAEKELNNSLGSSGFVSSLNDSISNSSKNDAEYHNTHRWSLSNDDTNSQDLDASSATSNDKQHSQRHEV